MNAPRRLRNKAKTRREDLYLFHPPKKSFDTSIISVHPLSASAMLCLRVGRLRPRFFWIYTAAACEQTAEVKGMVSTDTTDCKILADLRYLSLLEKNMLRYSGTV